MHMQAMCCDYGFRSGVGRLYQGSTGEVPKNFFALVRTTSECVFVHCSFTHMSIPRVRYMQP